MVYQEPMASLNPTMLIGEQLMEVPLIHDNVTKQEAQKRALLPPIADADTIATLAFTEPNGRWNTAGIEATATPAPEPTATPTPEATATPRADCNS